MAKIAFIGLGKMGLPMGLNLIKAGHELVGYDVSASARAGFETAGGAVSGSLEECLVGSAFVISMVNTGAHVRDLYTGDHGVIALAPSDALLMDCSTIDVDTARAVAAVAKAAGRSMIDAPVSGGVMGAEAGTLTFMVGGDARDFERVKPILAGMGRNIVHAGQSGNGQAAKICNNMMSGIKIIATSEAFALGSKLGLDYQTLFDIASTSSGQSWAMTTYCPVPGPVPTSPASNDYEPGFTAELMLKDLRLSQDAAASVGASTPLGACAASLYQALVNNGLSHKDCSIVAKLLLGELGMGQGQTASNSGSD